MNNDTQKDKFRFVEYSADAAERIGYSDYSYWKSVFQNFFKKKSAVVMAGVFFALVIFSFIALSIGKYNYSDHGKFVSGIYKAKQRILVWNR